MAFRIRTQPSAVLVLGLPALYAVAHILKKMFLLTSALSLSVRLASVRLASMNAF